VLDPANAPASFADMPPGCPYLTSTQLSTDGSHTLYAASKDRAGRLSAVKQVSWKFDHTPPTMGCAVTPKPLTPTDHRMVNIAANVGVTDALSGVKDFWLVSVSSNQPDSGLGPDDLPNDIQGFTFGTVDLAGQLRAEAYAGTRSYTLKYQAQDHAGNTAYCTPKDNVPLG
jgi:hypothetical protein